MGKSSRFIYQMSFLLNWHLGDDSGKMPPWPVMTHRRTSDRPAEGARYGVCTDTIWRILGVLPAGRRVASRTKWTT